MMFWNIDLRYRASFKRFSLVFTPNKYSIMDLCNCFKYYEKDKPKGKEENY